MKSFISLEKVNKVAIILLILGAGSGLLITAQWKTKNLRVSNPVFAYVALQDTRDKLTEEQSQMKNQIDSLQDEIKKDQEKLKAQNVSKKKVEEVEQYTEMVGLTEKQGKGVVITIDDSQTVEASIDSITHAADLRDLVNFLWSTGAEAIGINGERIVFNSSIDCIVNTILINSTKTTRPFTISVVGDQKRLLEGLQDENNLKDIYKRVKNEGMIFKITGLRNVIIPAYNGSFPIKFAKIN
ncbi:hypothetical protein A3F08_01590 [Candidatus Berkelbacteria bacterium RIFCSPHIGHO2_12_FULL_36_9]|uniref:DUF881 domain-containing protein n=1 Tax=Candidatus Berkelbacteria bacterium RIFCSPHIGHO2_12_FULL_36_9 TaxID=1797469 RepID=A0A1F5EKV8_9BACT|nr:MAG: hypothetical protein A3F08_01590 [Candidatus Berkelbacteria bacterium RIFCSPHIGHO2_12_FULL_36_9]